MPHPDSADTTFLQFLEKGIRLPDYQRDFAWGKSQMMQLWEDLRAHLFANSQTLADDVISKYYLGSIVVDNHAKFPYLVDGQQRFTTLTLIACAVRDALITSGFVDQAFEIHNSLIVDISKLADKSKRNRFELFDIPPGQSLSYEKRISPYRRRLVNIPTGLVTAASEKGASRIMLDREESGQYTWTLEESEPWSVMVVDGSERMSYSHPVDIIHKYGKMIRGGNAPPYIPLKKPLKDDIAGGLKLILENNVRSATLDWNPLSIPRSASEKQNQNLLQHSEIFHHTYRDFYRQVRRDAEHMIDGEKRFWPTDGFSEDQTSTTLRLERSFSRWVGSLQHCGRLPQKGEVITFHQEVVSKKEWPSDEELLKIMENNGAESAEVEWKGCFRYPIVGDKIRKNSQMMKWACTKAVASFLNTRGGFLFIGVSDKTGTATGIANENYKNPDDAIMVVSQYLKQKLGTDVGTYIDGRVIKAENYAEVLCIKVSRAPKFFEMDYMLFDDKDGAIRKKTVRKGAFFVRNPGESVELKGDQITNHKSLMKQEPIEYNLVPFRVETENISLDAASNNLHSLSGRVIDGDIPESAICSIPYLEPGQEWEGHLDSEDKRATELLNLVQNCIFTRISFEGDPKGAISHFMLTNDETRFSALTAYDLVSAFTQRLISTKKGERMTRKQRQIKEKWESISRDLYLAAGKDDKEIGDFFADWLLSTTRTKTPSKRFTKAQSWEGINNEFKKMTSPKGEYDYDRMLEFYSEMVEYALVYIRATNTDSEYWASHPYNSAGCRDERNYLKIIKSGPGAQRQHIAPYMALVHSLESQEVQDRGVISGFLKNYNYIILRYQTLPKFVGSGKSGVTGGDIYAKMTGADSWIQKIKDADLTDEAQRLEIQDLPLSLIQVADDAEGIFRWEASGDLNFGGTLESAPIKHLLFSAERALENTRSPSMSRLHQQAARPQVEHVLPKNASRLDERYFDKQEPTEEHAKLVFAFGNHCLLSDSLNSKVRNKPPTEKMKHYRDEFTTAQQVRGILRERGRWEEEEIKLNSTGMTSAIVSFYSPE